MSLKPDGPLATATLGASEPFGEVARREVRHDEGHDEREHDAERAELQRAEGEGPQSVAVVGDLVDLALLGGGWPCPSARSRPGPSCAA